MESNLSLAISFKGQIDVKAQAVPLQEGYLKLGGVADEDLTSPLAFGTVVSADPDTPSVFTAGITGDNVVRGIAIWDDAIAENAPAHPTGYLPGLPCAALAHGFCFVDGWTKVATGAIDPVIGCKVIFRNDSGVIEFLAAASDVPSGYTLLSNASVRDIDEDNGALIYLA